MIYQPRSIQPSWKSIDANAEAFISMIINTNNCATSYKLYIYDMENNLVYQSNKEDFPEPVYNGETAFIEIPTSLLNNGSDYKWIARLYQATSDMLITYGNVISPTTYVYTVGVGGLSQGNYCIKLGDYAYVFDTFKNLNEDDVLSFDSSDQTVTLIMVSSNSEYYLPTTKITLGNFANLTTTNSGTTYTYTVGQDGLTAGDYEFTINNKSIWFTTLSDLAPGDSISYDSSTNKVTQTHIQDAGNIVLSLTFVEGETLTFIQSENTTTQIFLKRNINIKDDMLLQIGSESKTITDYDIRTGMATVDSAYSAIPTSEDSYSVYSDFIETAPENILFVRETPTISITGGGATLTEKTADFRGVYSQSDDVPLVYFVWDLYSVNGEELSLIKTSGKKYSANIIFSYDGFKNGETYVLNLICENEFGIIARDSSTFNVDYEEVIYDERPTAEQTNEEGIRVSWLTTIPTEPYSEYIKTADGSVQSSNNTPLTLWLETNQEIYPGNTIVVGIGGADGIIESYDINTGYTVLKRHLNYTPVSGDSYYILSEPDYNLSGIDFLYNVPYNGVNSAQIKDYHLIYEKESGMSPWPTNYQFTAQFMLDKNFFYGDFGVYREIAHIARYQGSEDDESEDIFFFARGYKFCAAKPSVDNDSIVSLEITDIAEDRTSITIDNTGVTINPLVQKYLRFEDTETLVYIADYDDSTGEISFTGSLPPSLTPSVGENVIIYDAVEEFYYNSVNNAFCLQVTNTKNPYYDYIWSDSEYWNDSYYWVEGGTQIERAADTWWKVQFTQNNMIISKGGV